MILTFNYNDFLLRAHRADEFDRREGRRHRFQPARSSDRDRSSARRRRDVRCAPAWARWTVRGRSRALHGVSRFPKRSRRISDIQRLRFLRQRRVASLDCRRRRREGAKPPRQDPKPLCRARSAEDAAHEDLGLRRARAAERAAFSSAFRRHNRDLRARRHEAVAERRADSRPDGTREIAVPRGAGRPGQGDALDSLWQAVRNGRPSRHNARWGRDTIEVVSAVSAVREGQARGAAAL